MTIQEQGDWILIRLDPNEITHDVNWNTLVEWKIPEGERKPIDGEDAWLVKRKHRRLIQTLHFIYVALTAPDASSESLQEVSSMLANIEKWYPVKDQSHRELFDMLEFKKAEWGRN